MPQLDQDHHLFCAGARGHGEPRCQTAATPELPASDDAGTVQRGGDASASARGEDGDAPAESFLLRVRGGVGLAELFGAALRRDGSTKGGSNPKAAAEAEAATRKQGAPRADSRRLTASKARAAVVIGVLPAAGKVVAKERRARACVPGRVVVAARAWRRPAAGARVFASEAVGPEPVSPKVSCFGAVLPVPETPAADAAPLGRQEEEEEERGGCWASVAAALRGLCYNRNTDTREDESGAIGSDSKATTAPEPPPADALMSPPRPVAGLGDVKRLASRRWPETMAAEGRGSV